MKFSFNNREEHLVSYIQEVLLNPVSYMYFSVIKGSKLFDFSWFSVKVISYVTLFVSLSVHKIVDNGVLSLQNVCHN